MIGSVAQWLDQHNSRNFYKRSYTKINKGNWILVYSEQYNARPEAIKRERQLKSSRGRDYLKNWSGSSMVEQ